eukprot:1463225-Pleurochrysis_carterae.AAC.2
MEMKAMSSLRRAHFLSVNMQLDALLARIDNHERQLRLPEMRCRLNFSLDHGQDRFYHDVATTFPCPPTKFGNAPDGAKGNGRWTMRNDARATRKLLRN